jgi:hypothetical protein
VNDAGIDTFRIGVAAADAFTSALVTCDVFVTVVAPVAPVALACTLSVYAVPDAAPVNRIRLLCPRYALSAPAVPVKVSVCVPDPLEATLSVLFV